MFKILKGPLAGMWLPNDMTPTDLDQSGIYIWTTIAYLKSSLSDGWLRVQIGEAGKRKNSTRTMTDRLKEHGGLLSSQKIDDINYIGSITDPKINSDKEVHKALQHLGKDARPYKGLKNQPREFFDFRLPVHLKTDEEKLKYVFNQITYALKIEFNKSIRSTLKLRPYQDDWLVKLLAVLKTKNDANIVCEFCPRFGKTIMNLSIFEKSPHDTMIVAGYGIGQSALNSYKNEVTKYHAFEDMVVIDKYTHEPCKTYQKARAKGKKVIILVGLDHNDPEKFKESNKWIHKLEGPTLLVIEEADHGADCPKQIEKTQYLRENKTCATLSTSGTDHHGLLNALGAPVDYSFCVPYADLENDESFHDIVKRQFYFINLVDIPAIRKAFLAIPEKDRASLSKILTAPEAHMKFIELLMKSLFDDDYETGPLNRICLKSVINDECGNGGEQLDHVMMFVTMTNDEMGILANVIKSILPDWDVHVLNGDYTTSKNAENDIANEISWSDKEKHIILARDMGSRSFSLPDIQLVLFLTDGGGTYPHMQKYSRALTPKDGKKYAHIAEIGFDLNRKDSTLMAAILNEIATIGRNSDKTFEEATRYLLSGIRIHNLVNLDDNIIWRELQPRDIRSEYCTPGNLRATAKHHLTPILNRIGLKDLELLQEFGSNLEVDNKTHNVIPSKNYVSLRQRQKSKKSQNKAQEQKALVALERLVDSIEVLRDMTNYEANSFLDCFDKICNNTALKKEFKEIFAVSAIRMKNLVKRLFHSEELKWLNEIVLNNRILDQYAFESKNKDIFRPDRRKIWRDGIDRLPIDSNKCIFIADGGYGESVDALIEAFGANIVNSVIFQDKYHWACNRAKKKYPGLTVMNGDILGKKLNKNLKKLKNPVVLTNPPYVAGKNKTMYVKHIDNVIDKLDPMAILMITPDNLLLRKKNAIRRKLIEKYGNPKYINWLNKETDWNNIIKQNTQLSIWDKSIESKTTKITSRFENNEFDIDIDFNDVFFSMKSEDEYNYVMGIQTDEKLQIKNYQETGQVGKIVSLKAHDNYEIIEGNEFNSSNHAWRQVVAMQRTKSLVDIGPGPSVPKAYAELICRYSPIEDETVSKKFGRYMRSAHTKFLVSIRYHASALTSPTFELVPIPDLDKLPDDFTDENLYEYFNTPQSVIDDIEKLDESPY